MAPHKAKHVREVRSSHVTRVKVDSGLSYDQLRGHRGLRVMPVEQPGDLQ